MQHFELQQLCAEQHECCLVDSCAKLAPAPTVSSPNKSAANALRLIDFMMFSLKVSSLANVETRVVRPRSGTEKTSHAKKNQMRRTRLKR